MATQRAPQSATGTESKSIAERIAKPSGKIGTLGTTIYGKGGAGKTTLLGTMPGKGLVVDIPQVEGGTMVLANVSDRIDVFPAVVWADLGDLYKYLRDESHKYNWYAIDTVTATQELAKRKTLQERDLSADPRIITQQDWGKIGELQRELFYQYRTLPLHGIFVAQERLRASGEEGSQEYQPDISPSALSGLIPSMSLIARLFTREVEDKDTKELVVERRLRTGTHPNTVTKARAVAERPMPQVIREPNLGKIFGWLLGSKGAQSPEAVVEDTSLFVD